MFSYKSNFSCKFWSIFTLRSQNWWNYMTLYFPVIYNTIISVAWKEALSYMLKISSLISLPKQTQPSFFHFNIHKNKKGYISKCENPDQFVQMRRLFWAFPARSCCKLSFMQTISNAFLSRRKIFCYYHCIFLIA